MKKRETAFANQISAGDRIEAVAIVDRAEIHGEDVTLYFSGKTTVKADERLWRHVDPAS